jgi:hypothetical protein
MGPAASPVRVAVDRVGERAPHQIGPRPAPGDRCRCRVVGPVRDGTRSHRRLNRRRAVGDHARPPAGMPREHAVVEHKVDPRPWPTRLHRGVQAGRCPAVSEGRKKASARPCLQRLPSCSLPFQEKCLWQRTFASRSSHLHSRRLTGVPPGAILALAWEARENRRGGDRSDRAFGNPRLKMKATVTPPAITVLPKNWRSE